MKTFQKLTFMMVLAASAAFANDQLTQMRDHAKTLHQEFTQLQSAVKNRNFDVQTIQNRMNELDANIEKLKSIAAEFESSAPSNIAASSDWKLTKELIQLLDMFHEQKMELLNGDLRKNHGLVKVHAEGLARRAEILSKTTDKMLKHMSQSGS